jgi:D-glycero-alpha-D-manno-heptose-7-phosphate kinase
MLFRSAMIVTRSPLRISLGGGGTDLPSFYEQEDGYVISAAIDKYVYTSVIRPFEKGIYLKYSEHEHVDFVDEIKHSIIRETMRTVGFSEPQIEVTTLADVPAGTGLGSSSAFTASLLMALNQYKRLSIGKEVLAKEACRIEIDILEQPIGKQDQYASVYGGLKELKFLRDGSVDVSMLPINADTINDLEDNLLLFFTGYSRNANDILQQQDDRTKLADSDMMTNLRFVKHLGYETRNTLCNGDMKTFAKIMNEHWEYKQARSSNMSNECINEWYRLGLKNGALGGKLVGAGGGGFIMFYADDKRKLCNAMTSAGLSEMRFKFDFAGTTLVMGETI